MPELKPSGLEDVVVGPSEITFLDGLEGRLLYRGYDIHDLAAQATFEEVVYLLWKGDLPDRRALEAFRAELAAQMPLPDPVLDLLRRMPRTAQPMSILRTAVSFLGAVDPEPERQDAEASYRRAVQLTAMFPTIVATSYRLQRGMEPVIPDPSLDIAGNFLYMLHGHRPDDFIRRIFDVCLILHADHELNASTFAARVVAATESDVYSAVTAAVGALKGPLHGGANEEVMRLLLKIGDPSRAEPYIREALANKVKIPGFHHRVYRTEDPRAHHLREFSRQLGERSGDTKWFAMQQIIERVMLEVKGFYPNVDFYSATTYYAMGIPFELYTPIFAVSRISGWLAHILEQYAHNRLIRPRAEYVGPARRTFVPLDQR